MSDLGDIDLHDSLLKEMSIDYVARVVTVVVDFYRDNNSRARERAIIRFDDVESISQICDFDHLQKNASAGNINYWAPAKGKGVTFIYVVDGCISITAVKVTMTLVSEKDRVQPA